MANNYLTEKERYNAIQAAFDKLPEDEQIVIDLQVKRILDYIERLNADRVLAKHQLSRVGAMQIIAAIGYWPKVPQEI